MNSAYFASTASAHLDPFASNHLPDPATWPEMDFSLPHLRYPEQLNCVSVLLDQHCEQGLGNKIAIFSEKTSWTYAQLQQKVDQIAHVLTDEMGLVAGNRVLLRAANTPMMAASILAVFKAGCIAIITMPLLRAKELQWMIEKAQIQAALCSESLLEELQIAQKNGEYLKQIMCFDQIDEIDQNDHMKANQQSNAQHQPNIILEKRMPHYHLPFQTVPTRSDDVCLIAFTSGTTGVPKASMHFHRDLIAICDSFPKSILQTTAQDIFIATSPLAFTFGLGASLLFPLRVGSSVVLLAQATPAKLLEAIHQFKATICFSVPTFYRQVIHFLTNDNNELNQINKLASLQKSVSAGEFLSIETREKWKLATGLDMIDGLGTTELLHIFISAAGNDIRAGATGKVIAGYQACVLDDNGSPCPPNVIGALAVKGPTGCRYLDDDRQTQYVVDAWNRTGDAYSVDVDGYFYYHDRLDNMIISSGYNIASREIEDVLLTHPSIEECAVIGIADEERGNIVKAFVVLKMNHQACDLLVKILQEFVRERIAPFKYPRAIEFVSTLPRTENGKIQRYKLKHVESTLKTA
jgi:2-aminobenzoate-CoA ligase